MKEMVNHPKHYNLCGRKECINEMVDIFGIDTVISWCILTCYKYRYRIGNKDKVEQENGKINWYEKWVEDHIVSISNTDIYSVWVKYNKIFKGD